MKKKQLLSSTHVDCHGMRMSKSALDSAAEQINGPFVVGMGIEHDVLLPPIGKIVKASVEKLPDGEYGLFGEYKLFNSERTKEITLPNGEQAIIDTWEDERPFADRHEEIPSKIEFSMDPVNFESEEDRKNFLIELQKDGPFEEKMLMRKSFIPDPELMIKLSEQAVNFLIAHQLLKRTGQKIVEDVSNDISNLYTIIRNSAIKYAKYCIPKNRPITYLLVAPGTPSTEFVIRTANAEEISEAVGIDKLANAFEEAEKFNDLFDAQKIQFLLNKEGNWSFNYLLTKTGKVVGSKDAIRRREKAVELIYKQHSGNN